MINSMTAYGRGECRLGDTLFMAEIKGLNHRFLDIVLRMPRNLMALEKDLKDLISSRIQRGRIEVFLEMQNQEGNIPYELELNEPLAKSYIEIYDRLTTLAGTKEKVSVSALWQMKDVIISKPAEIDSDIIQKGFETSLTQALETLQKMRRREGQAIESDFAERTTLLKRYLDQVEQSTPQIVETYRKRLEENVKRMLLNVPADDNRLAQEVAIFAEKSDITEEIVRFKSHLDQFRHYLTLEDVVGRKLDFLIQEINREVNTIGSKTADSSVSGIVVEMKAELEKLREQVQNVE